MRQQFFPSIIRLLKINNNSKNLQYLTCRNVSLSVKKNNTTTIKSTTNIKKKICIVGAGPAGFYAAQYLIKHLPNTEIDILEKLPVPFGLVRFGVAPDHPEVKNVINTFTKTAEHPSIRFLGNLSLGKDYSLCELRDSYHAVLLAYGAEEDRKLNIPNETDETVLSAREFVAWYNGLPGSENFQPKLNQHKTVGIIGQGNVAMDVARILLSSIDSLRKTDITENALAELTTSQVKKVYMIGRRSPLQAAFTIKELREMTKLNEMVHINWRSEDFLNITDELPNLPRPRKRMTELMLSSLEQQQKRNKQQNAKRNDNNNNSMEKLFLPIFLRSPQLIDPITNHLTLTVNQMAGNSAIPTNISEIIETDIIMRSIGYKSINLDTELNFNESQGYVNNHGGRVLKKFPPVSDISIDTIEDKYERGLYVTGWLATGPTGVIVTTMNNSFGVAGTICEDVKNGTLKFTESKPGILLAGRDKVVTWTGWKQIDAAECNAAISSGGKKPREKIIDINKMLNIALN